MSTLKLSKTEDIEVFIDPFRTKIMRIMKNADRPMTVKEIADSMDVSPAKVYYHVKKLESIGVLFIKYTKEINGIIAKYYDFTADTISLEVPQTEDAKTAVHSRMTKLYGSYFDEAKQKFYDSITPKPQDDKNEQNIFINVKNSLRIAPGKAKDFWRDVKTLTDRYRCSDADAEVYYLFSFMIQTKDGAGQAWKSHRGSAGKKAGTPAEKKP